MSNFIEGLARLLTELTGSTVSNKEAIGVVGTVVVCVVILLFAFAWHKSEQKQWDEIKRLEEEGKLK